MKASREGFGVDIGTAYMVCAQSDETHNDKIRLNSVRNCFIVQPPEQAMSLDISGVPYIEGHQGLYILGQDAVELAGVTGEELRRPLSQGFISAKEEQGKEVVSLILSKIMGSPSKSGDVVAFSVPGPVYNTTGVLQHNPASQVNLGFHSAFFKDLLTSLGYNAIPVNEAVAVAYSEMMEPKNKQHLPLTALAISFGAGMVNIALVYKSMLVRSFSLNMGGDYIDRGAAEATSSPVSQITLLKEHGVDLLTGKIVNRDETHDAQSDRQAEAISIMYRDLLSKVTEAINSFFAMPANRTEIPDTIPVVVSGGTCLSPKFMELFDEVVIQGLDVRFKFWAEPVRAQNPLNSVALGTLAIARMRSSKK